MLYPCICYVHLPCLCSDVTINTEGDLINLFEYINVASMKGFLQGPVVTGQGAMILN